MADFFRAHGLRLGVPILALVALWAAALIVAPLVATTVRSLHATAPTAAAAEIARLDAELAAVRSEWEHTSDPERRAELDRRTRLLGARQQSYEREGSSPVTLWSLHAYGDLLGAPAAALAARVGLALLVTLITLVAGYPFAHLAATGSSGRARVMFAALIVPFALADPLRAWAWATMVGPGGLLSNLLVGLGLLDVGSASALFHGPPNALLPTMAYALLPMAVLPMWVALRTLDPRLVEAARDLGASPFQIQRRIVLPHALPGIVVGAIVTFVFAAGAHAVVHIAGHARDGFAAAAWREVADGPERAHAAAEAVVLALVCLVVVHAILGLFGLRLGDVIRRRGRHA